VPTLICSAVPRLRIAMRTPPFGGETVDTYEIGLGAPNLFKPPGLSFTTAVFYTTTYPQTSRRLSAENAAQSGRLGNLPQRQEGKNLRR